MQENKFLSVAIGMGGLFVLLVGVITLDWAAIVLGGVVAIAGVSIGVKLICASGVAVGKSKWTSRP